MKSVFIDTSFYVAFLNTLDVYHQKAVELAQQLPTVPIVVTTEYVLVELANYFHRRQRAAASNLIQNLLDGDGVQIVPSNSTLLRRGFELYSNRPDKTWSLTDCISFIVMQDQGLVEALTTDMHFVQAGFQPLLIN